MRNAMDVHRLALAVGIHMATLSPRGRSMGTRFCGPTDLPIGWCASSSGASNPGSVLRQPDLDSIEQRLDETRGEALLSHQFILVIIGVDYVELSVGHGSKISVPLAVRVITEAATQRRESCLDRAG